MQLAPLLQETENPFALTIDPYWILVSIVQFLILFWLLRRFLWGPVTRTLETRATKIREGLQLAESARAERERLQQEVDRRLAEASREAQAAAERMTKAAEDAAATVRNEAKAEAERIRERAREDAKQLHDQALAQLRGEVAGIVVAAASRVLGREVDATKHRDLIERALDEAGTQMAEGA